MSCLACWNCPSDTVMATCWHKSQRFPKLHLLSLSEFGRWPPIFHGTFREPWCLKMLEQLSIEITCSNKSPLQNPTKRKVKEVHCILDWDYLHIFSSCVKLDVVLKVVDVQPAGLGAVTSKSSQIKDGKTITPSCPLAIEEDLALCRSGPCKIHLSPSEFIWCVVRIHLICMFILTYIYIQYIVSDTYLIYRAACAYAAWGWHMVELFWRSQLSDIVSLSFDV